MVKVKNSQTLYFVELNHLINHGFSWNAPNMSFKFGERVEVLKILQYFFKLNKLNKYKHFVNIQSEHKDKIIFLEKQELKHFNSSDIFLECDCVVTNSKDLVILVKPADCAICLIYGTNQKEKFCAVLHVGRNGLDLNLATKTINYLVEDLKIEKTSIKIAISPMISGKYYFIQKKDLHILKNFEIWQDFIKYQRNKCFLDLKGLLKQQFFVCGIKEKQILDSHLDTYENARTGLSFSNRYSILNSKPQGRMLVYGALN